MGTRNRARPRRRTPSIQEVWASNFDHEILRLQRCLQANHILSIDTEFPGCIRSTPWGSIDERVYEDLRFNVNQTKLIQLGLTASDESGQVAGSWEFNFSDFDHQIDTQNPSSISFLEQNGLDFAKLKKQGIPLSLFTLKFSRIIRRSRVRKWVTFHGLYDIGYLVKAMGVAEELPESMEEFAEMVARGVGVVRDLKEVARWCEGLEQGKVGLERFGELLGEKRFGMKHHAGSDSLLTAFVHAKMARWLGLESGVYDGHLYGLQNKFEDMKVNQRIMFGQISCSLWDYE